MSHLPSLRLALISTPRSGNNWLQHLLSTAYDLPRLSADTLPQVDWARLPPRCALILHWPRTPQLVDLLDQHGCRVLVLARHPCDVLLSILQFSLHHDPDRWLERSGGDERAIVGALPISPEFLAYATGPRAAALLDVSRQWWTEPGVQAVRYEELVANPQVRFEQVINALGVPPIRSAAEAVVTNTLTELRRQHAAARHHFWQGRPGIWRMLLPASIASAIFCAHRVLFRELGYECAADPALDEAQAEVNWYRLTWPRLVEDLQTTRDRLAVAHAQREPSPGWAVGRLRGLARGIRSSFAAGLGPGRRPRRPESSG